MPTKTFTDNEILTAADVNAFLVNRDPLLLPKANRAVDVPSASTGDINVTVTYTVSYPVGTVVAVSPSMNSPFLTAPRVTASSATGFTVRITRTGVGPYSFDWVAMPVTE